MEINKDHFISVEAAGAGFAASIALAAKFHGQLISAKPALFAAGIALPDEGDGTVAFRLSAEEFDRALAACRKVRATLREQADGWQKRPLFERQWTVRDFRKEAGMPVEEWLEGLDKMEAALAARDADALAGLRLSIDRLAGYYGHLAKLAADYYKDPAKRDEYVGIVLGWQREAEELAGALGHESHV